VLADHGDVLGASGDRARLDGLAGSVGIVGDPPECPRVPDSVGAVAKVRDVDIPPRHGDEGQDECAQPQSSRLPLLQGECDVMVAYFIEAANDRRHSVNDGAIEVRHLGHDGDRVVEFHGYYLPCVGKSTYTYIILQIA